MLLKASAVTPDQLKSYRAFQKAISDDYATYIYLRVSADVAAITLLPRPHRGLPASGSYSARAPCSFRAVLIRKRFEAEQDARKAMQADDYTSAITALKHAVSLDPTFSRAWIELGVTYAESREGSSSLNAFRKPSKPTRSRLFPTRSWVHVHVPSGTATMQLPLGRNCNVSLPTIPTWR